jgi:hypothetical protein
MKKLLPFIFLIVFSSAFALPPPSITFTVPSPQYGCPNTTHNVTIGATNTSGISLPPGTVVTATLTIKDNTNTNTLGTTTQTFSSGLANGATQYFTIPGVAFVGPMVCNVTGNVSFTYIVPQSYPISTTYTVQSPPDLTISESPTGTLAVSTALNGYSVNYYLNANYGTVDHTTTATTYTPSDVGSYTSKAYDPVSGCLSVNASNSVVITKAIQTITFPALSAATMGEADYAPGATSTNNGIAITYMSSNTSVVTIVSGNIHIVGVGTTTITAQQAGDATHFAATDVPQSLTVNALGTGVQGTLSGSVTIYPNPASDVIFVELDNSSASVAELTLTDMMGLEISKVHFSKQGNSLGAELTVSHLAEGIYFLHIQSDTGITCKKITKK